MNVDAISTYVEEEIQIRKENLLIINNDFLNNFMVILRISIEYRYACSYDKVYLFNTNKIYRT